jgi:hypothetical protein
MKCSITKTLKQHLEYIGYTVEDRSDSEDSDLIIADHPRRPRLILRTTEDEIIYIKTLFGIYSASREREILNELCEKNNDTILTKWRVIKDDADENKLYIRVDASQIGYDKSHFPFFLDFFNTEIQENMPSFEQYTIENNLLLLPQLTE